MAKPIRMRGKWRIRWFDENGVRQSAVYDDYKVAQKELSRRLVEVEETRRGTRLAPVDKTFNELCDYWIKNKAAQKRSGTHDESIIRCHLRGTFGHLPLAGVGVQQVDEFIVARSHLHKKTLHNVLTLLISMLRLGCELGWIARAPKIKKPRVRVFDRDFHYLRTADEVRRFLDRRARGGGGRAGAVRDGRLHRHARGGARGSLVGRHRLREAAHQRAA